MKITMQTMAAGPLGVAKPGSVIDVPQQEAEQMMAGKFARPFDKDRDRKAKLGWDVARESDE